MDSDGSQPGSLQIVAHLAPRRRKEDGENHGICLRGVLLRAVSCNFSVCDRFLGNFGVPKSIDSGAEIPFVQALAINAACWDCFAVQHSVMARQGFKALWTRDCTGAGGAEHVRVVFQRGFDRVVLEVGSRWGEAIWNVENSAGRLALNALFAVGWLTVLATTFLIDHFDLFWNEPGVAYLRKRAYKAPGFRTPGGVPLVRHPLYVGWLLVFWSAPRMTAAHLVFAIATTAYILVAIQFEERDLAQNARRVRGVSQASADARADRSINSGKKCGGAAVANEV